MQGLWSLQVHEPSQRCTVELIPTIMVTLQAKYGSKVQRKWYVLGERISFFLYLSFGIQIEKT